MWENVNNFMDALSAARISPRPDRPAYPISLGDLAQALDHSDEGFALTDPEGNYVYINDAHLRMYGYERPQDLLGRSWRTLYTPEWVRHFEEQVLPIMPRDKVWRGQVLGRRRDGTAFLAGVTLTLLPDGKITCNCRDESLPRAVTAADAGETSALRELGIRIVASLPGRLRRPVDMLSGYSSFLLAELQRAPLDAAAPMRAGLDEIDAAGRSLAEQVRRLELVAELFLHSRFRAPQAAAGRGWPAKTAAECREKARRAGRENDLLVDLSADLPALESEALELIVLELLGNALESSRPGDAVRVRGSREGGHYILEVCDEGIGMAAGQLESESPPERIIGQAAPTGFGLALVRCLIKRAGGTLAAAHHGECSTCIRVSLPLAG